MKIKLLSVFIALSGTVVSFAQTFDIQTEAELEMKYWSYRYRLLGDDFDYNKYPGFIRIGENPGFSMPAITRNRATDCSWDYFDPNMVWFRQYIDEDFSCANQGVCPNSTLKGEIKFQDNPLIEMGQYIGVLATEWKLLNLSNVSGSRQTELNAVELEIYYSLEALNRLDNYAETIYNLSASNNGFLARADVPQDFAQNNFGDFYDLTEAPSICNAGDNNGMGNKCEPNNQPLASMQRNVMSQDEVYGVFVGLRLIAACLPNGVVVNNMDLREEAIYKTTQIISYMQMRDWHILDPLGNRVCRGNNATAFSFPICKMYKHMTGDEIQDNISSVLGWLEWSYLEDNFDGQDVNICATLFYGIIDATNVDDPGWLCAGINAGTSINMFLKVAALSSTWSASNLDLDCYESAHGRPIYSLLSSFLDDRAPNDPPPLLFPGNAYSFWLNYLNSFECNPQIPANDYESNGLEYMLAFNLFRLVFHGSPAYYLGNLINRVDFATYPYPDHPTNWGSNQYPVIHRALDTYTLQGVVMNEHANVIFMAQNDITINPPVDDNNIGDGNWDYLIGDPFDCIPNYYVTWDNSELCGSRFYDLPMHNGPNSLVIQENNQNQLQEAIKEFYIYPNPASSKFSISVPDFNKYTCCIIDVYGKQISNVEFTGTLFQIDISNLSEGVYTIQVFNQNGMSIGFEKLVVQ